MSILNVPWLWFRNGVIPSTRPGSQLDDDANLSVETTTDKLDEDSDSIASDLLRYIMFSGNWPEPVDTPEKLNELMKLGYQFNAWPVETAGD
jgi:hypothetical protein